MLSCIPGNGQRTLWKTLPECPLPFDEQKPEPVLFTYLTKRSYRGSAVARLDLFGGVGGVGENHKPRRRELLGWVRGHAHPEDFKLYGLSNSIVSLHRAFIPRDFSLLKP